MKKFVMRGALFALVVGPVVLAPSAASAATVLFSLTNLSGTTSSGVTFTTQSASSSGETVNVRVSAWTLSGTSGAGTVAASTLGFFGSNGLGAVGAGESSSTNTHALDNETNRDFFLFQFDKQVKLEDGYFNPFAVGGTATDTDYTVGRGTSATPWTTQINLTGMSSAALTTMFGGVLNNYAGATTASTQLLNPSAGYGNVWLVGASFNNSGTLDSFKFRSLRATTGAVPEASTWMMMIAGFGIAGMGLRRKRSGSAQIA